MENRLTRRLLGTFAGIVAGLIVIMLIGQIDVAFYPFADADPSAGIDALPPLPFGALAFVVAGWLFGPLTGVLIALRIDHWDPSAWIITALSVAGAAWNAIGLPAPDALLIASIVAALAGGIVGLGMSRWWLARRYARGRVHNGGRGPAG